MEKEAGMAFWFARGLQNLLGYTRWENFIKVIDKVKIACKSSSYKMSDHFPDVTKMIGPVPLSPSPGE